LSDESRDISSEILQIIDEIIYPINFKSIKIYKHHHRIGLWNNKLFALYDSIKLGSDVTFLLEDDVIISPDSLELIRQASLIMHKNNHELYSISLYSPFLINKKLNYNSAKDFISQHGDIKDELLVNFEPNPWGIALSKSYINILRQSRWNGNDRKMTLFSISNKVHNIFPVISRSEHIGEIKISNRMVLPMSHLLPINTLNSQSFSIDANIENVSQTDFYNKALRHDEKFEFLIIKIFTDKINVFNKYDELSKSSKFFIDIQYININKVLVNGKIQSSLHEIIDMINTKNIYLDIDNVICREYVLQFLSRDALLEIKSLNDLSESELI